MRREADWQRSWRKRVGQLDICSPGRRIREGSSMSMVFAVILLRWGQSRRFARPGASRKARTRTEGG